VVTTLTKLTTRSPVVMTELRRLWYLLDTNDIHIRPRYIRSIANIYADTLSRELDTEDWQLNPRLFAHLQARWGPHSIDRFDSMLNTQLPRFNAINGATLNAKTSTAYACPTRHGDAKTATATPLGLPFLPSPPNCANRATATVVAPHWPNKTWYQDLQRLVAHILHFPPWLDPLFPGGLGKPAGVEPPAWSIEVFRVTPMPCSTPDATL
jgi:hypothetical protein